MVETSDSSPSQWRGPVRGDYLSALSPMRVQRQHPSLLRPTSTFTVSRRRVKGLAPSLRHSRGLTPPGRISVRVATPRQRDPELAATSDVAEDELPPQPLTPTPTQDSVFAPTQESVQPAPAATRLSLPRLTRRTARRVPLPRRPTGQAPSQAARKPSNETRSTPDPADASQSAPRDDVLAAITGTESGRTLTQRTRPMGHPQASPAQESRSNAARKEHLPSDQQAKPAPTTDSASAPTAPSPLLRRPNSTRIRGSEPTRSPTPPAPSSPVSDHTAQPASDAETAPASDAEVGSRPDATTIASNQSAGTDAPITRPEPAALLPTPIPIDDSAAAPSAQQIQKSDTAQAPRANPPNPSTAPGAPPSPPSAGASNLRASESAPESHDPPHPLPLEPQRTGSSQAPETNSTLPQPTSDPPPHHPTNDATTSPSAMSHPRASGASPTSTDSDPSRAAARASATNESQEASLTASSAPVLADAPLKRRTHSGEQQPDASQGNESQTTTTSDGQPARSDESTSARTASSTSAPTPTYPILDDQSRGLPHSEATQTVQLPAATSSGGGASDTQPHRTPLPAVSSLPDPPVSADASDHQTIAVPSDIRAAVTSVTGIAPVTTAIVRGDVVAKAAQALLADGFTHGGRVHLPGTAPLTSDRQRRLLAHELTHVVQQGRGRHLPTEDSPHGQRLEQAALAAETLVTTSANTSDSGLPAGLETKASIRPPLRQFSQATTSHRTSGNTPGQTPPVRPPVPGRRVDYSQGQSLIHISTTPPTRQPTALTSKSKGSVTDGPQSQLPGAHKSPSTHPPKPSYGSQPVALPVITHNAATTNATPILSPPAAGDSASQIQRRKTQAPGTSAAPHNPSAPPPLAAVQPDQPVESTSARDRALRDRDESNLDVDWLERHAAALYPIIRRYLRNDLLRDRERRGRLVRED